MDRDNNVVIPGAGGIRGLNGNGQKAIKLNKIKKNAEIKVLICCICFFVFVFKYILYNFFYFSLLFYYFCPYFSPLISHAETTTSPTVNP